MRSHGLPVDDGQVVYATALSLAEGLRCGRELLEGNSELTAIVAGNDMLAVGCYGAFDELGMRCPQDVSIIGFNDMPFIDRLRPPLSTVRFPHYQLGTEAANLLLERINTGGGPVKILYLAPELVVRGSAIPVGPQAVPDLPGAGDAPDEAEPGRATGGNPGVRGRRQREPAIMRLGDSYSARPATGAEPQHTVLPDVVGCSDAYDCIRFTHIWPYLGWLAPRVMRRIACSRRPVLRLPRIALLHFQHGCVTDWICGIDKPL
jgi:hypothetical protein